jgi:predicted metal-dependent RNase
VTTAGKNKVEISQAVLQHIPEKAEVTRIEFEGPALAVYTKRPEILIEQSSINSQKNSCESRSLCEIT